LWQHLLQTHSPFNKEAKFALSENVCLLPDISYSNYSRCYILFFHRCLTIRRQVTVWNPLAPFAQTELNGFQTVTWRRPNGVWLNNAGGTVFWISFLLANLEQTKMVLADIWKPAMARSKLGFDLEIAGLHAQKKARKSIKNFVGLNDMKNPQENWTHTLNFSFLLFDQLFERWPFLTVLVQCLTVYIICSTVW
jgi:hypothetical protein